MKKIARKLVPFLSILLMLLQSIVTPFLVSPVYAATSPWTQTDWSTGDFASSANVTTSTVGQVTLATIEKLTNGEFTTGTEGGVAASWSTATVSAPPAGYVEVPSNVLYANPATYDATQPSKSNFLVMQYEAKYDCTATPDGDGDTAATCSAPADGGAGLDYRDIVGFSTSRVVSTANGAPIVHTDQTQSASACPTGYHLITTNEWMTIARNVEAQGANWANGTIGSTVASGGGLKRGNVGNVDSVGYNGADPEQGTGRNTKAKLVLSNGAELWDLSGNVWDRNSDTIMGADKPHNNAAAWVEWTVFAPPGASTYSALSYDLTRPSDSDYNSGYGIGLYYEGANPDGPYVFLRGGDQSSISNAGVFALLLHHVPTFQHHSVGFRCASNPVAIFQSFSSSSGRTGGGGDTVTVGSISDAKLYQSVNVGDTASYYISAYVYNNTAGSIGGTVDATVASLYYGGNAITGAAYTPVVGEAGWYKLTGTVTGVASAVQTGLLVKTGKTVIVDDLSIYNNYSPSGTLTSSIFDTEFSSGAAWGTLTYTATTPLSTSVTVKVRSSNSASMTGAPDFATCTAITSTSDISGNNCMADSHRYIQYQLTVATTDPLVTPTFQDISIAFASYDADAPGISLTALTPDPTNDNTPALSGTATDAIGTVTAVQFQMDSTAGSWTACTANDSLFDSASEAFICTVSSALSDGSHSMNIRATDSNGNTTANGSVTTDTFTVDVTAPTTPGTPSTTSPTSDTSPTWDWTASTDATAGLATTPYTVEWSQSSSFASGVSSSTSVTNSFTHVTPLTDGTWYFRIKATDAAGNDSASSANGSVIVDSTAPTTPGIPSTTSPTNSSSQTWSWTAATDAISGVGSYAWRVIDSFSNAITDGATAATSVITNLTEGAYTFFVKAIDNLGNESAETSGSVIVDTTPPAISLTVFTPDPTTDTTPSFTGTVTEAVGTVAAVEFQMDGTAGSWSNCITDDATFDEASETFTCTVATALSAGSHTIYVRATDSNTNTTGSGDYVTDTVTITIAATSSSDNNDGDSDSDNNDDNDCNDEVGIQPPWLYSAIAQNSSSILLYFTEAADPVEKYDLEYGTKTNEYSTHKEDIDVESESKMNYLIKDLKPNTTYYFRVRGVNGCANGDWSNEISTATKSAVVFNNLQFTSSEFEPVWQPIPTPEDETNDGNFITQPTDQPENIEETVKDNEVPPSVTQEGYTVKIKVIDEENKPVEGAKVTIHSEVQEGVTDKEGLAVFENVEKGDHRVIIAYNGFEGEQALNLTGDVKEFSLEIKIKPQNVMASPIYLWSVGILGALAIFLFFRKRK